jgi:hypothetical protein
VGLSKATNYCTPDVQFIHIQENTLSNRRGLRSEPRCVVRKTGKISGAVLITSRIDKINAQIGKQIAPIRIIIMCSFHTCLKK